MADLILKTYRLLRRAGGRWRSRSPHLEGGLFALLSGVFLILVVLVVPDRREISADKYRWLSEQRDAFPAISERLFAALANDGRITNAEWYQLRRELQKLEKAQLKKALWRQWSDS
jgi:hypothetical protein